MRPKVLFSGFTGSAAWELQAIDPALRPPVAYMGSKRSLARPIFEALDLTPGCGADTVILCDAGPWGWVWQALAVPETARAVASVLRGWAGEDPTTLWRRLAAEPPPSEAVDRAAATLWIQGRTPGNVAAWHDGARWVMSEAPGHGALMSRVREKGTTRGRPAGIRSPATVAARVEAIADAVARYLAMQAHAPSGIPVWPSGGGWRQDGRNFTGGRVWGARERRACRGNKPPRVTDMAARCDVLATTPWPSLVVHAGRIEDLTATFPEDLSGWVAYLDPPYVGCTGYAADCAREAVLDLARMLSARGALVCISEAEPLSLRGWDTRDVTHERESYARSTKPEWLTFNRSIRAARQFGPLFAWSAA